MAHSKMSEDVVKLLAERLRFLENYLDDRILKVGTEVMMRKGSIFQTYKQVTEMRRLATQALIRINNANFGDYLMKNRVLLEVTEDAELEVTGNRLHRHFHWLNKVPLDSFMDQLMCNDTKRVTSNTPPEPNNDH